MAVTLEPRPTVPDARAWTIHGQDTLPRLFRHVVRERGDAVAMREKHLGIWRSITWRQYGERAKHVGLGLVALGFQPRDVVSVIAENCPEWLYTDLGTMSVGGVTNGIYTTDSASQIEYIVNDSGTRFFFAENEEQLDKILQVRKSCPQLVKIIVYDMDGLHAFTDPHVMPFAVPRIWEKFYPGVELRMREATLVGRLAYGWAISVGGRMAAARIEGRRPSAGLRLLYRVANFLVLDNLRRSIGMHRARGAATGAAPIAPELVKWYLSLGIDMREVYGQTENCGLATAMPADRIKLGTVGRARPDTEVRLSPDGEILLKGPHVFLGYHNKPEKTAETIVDGWLHTGDVGSMDADGFLTITDRMK